MLVFLRIPNAPIKPAEGPPKHTTPSPPLNKPGLSYGLAASLGPKLDGLTQASPPQARPPGNTRRLRYAFIVDEFLRGVIYPVGF